jgi:uncharacterized protein YndB with AHSA1/START domain
MTTQNQTKIGTLAVRRSILINAAPERIWQEFESFEKLAAWFGRGHRLLEYEPRLGGNVLLEVEHEGQTLRYGGPVIVFEPASELTFENDWIPNTGWPAPTLITLRLTPALDGTLVELFHHMIENTGDDRDEWHAGFEKGWDMKHLIALKQIIERRERVSH